MHIIQNAAVFFIAIIHVWIMYLEMVLWTKPIGLKTFRIDAEFAQRSASLAKNQGLYNGFLAVGLFWSIFASDPINFQLKIFFLSCVLVAGIYGALTASKKILYVQSLPALIALILVFI